MMNLRSTQVIVNSLNFIEIFLITKRKMEEEHIESSQLQNHDVLIIILSFLDFADMCKSASRVSVAWNYYGWYCVNCVSSDNTNNQFKSNWKRIQKVVLQRGHNMKQLCMTNNKSFNNHALRKFCRVMTKLEHLNVSGCAITDESLKLIASSFPLLKYLNISQCNKCTASGLKYIIQSCGGTLQELDISDIGIKMDIFKKSECNMPFNTKRMERLRAAFGTMKNLKVLKCFNCFIINPKILSGITNLDTLEFSVGVVSQWNGTLSKCKQPDRIDTLTEEYIFPLQELSTSIDHMKHFKLGGYKMNLPELKSIVIHWAQSLHTLYLHDVILPSGSSEYITSLIQLRNLRLTTTNIRLIAAEVEELQNIARVVYKLYNLIVLVIISGYSLSSFMTDEIVEEWSKPNLWSPTTKDIILKGQQQVSLHTISNFASITNINITRLN
jgi:hypothetical protein